MPVIYNSKKIIPAPFVSVKKEYDTADDSRIVGSTFIIQLNGKIVAFKGSPNSSGTFWTSSGYPSDEVIAADSRLTVMLRKQEALRSLFATEGLTFEVQGYDGLQPLKCNPRIRSIEFSPGLWFDTQEYTITLEADIVYINGTAQGEDSGDVLNYKIRKASEEWNMEISDENLKTYRLTHSVSAIGKRFFNSAGSLTKHAWENARDYVLNKIGVGIDTAKMIGSGVIDGNDLSAYNYLRSQNVNEYGGTFGIQENWLCFAASGEPPALEEWTVTTQYKENGQSTVDIDGTITGLEVRDNTTYVLQSTKWENAANKWNNYVNPNLLARAETISALDLHPTPLSKRVGYNRVNGVISYNYGYDDRATLNTPGALSEVITITNNGATDIFASIPILGRAIGPLLQTIGTVSEKKRTINIEIVMPASRQGFTATAPDTDQICLDNMPSSPYGVYLSQNDESWSAQTGRYSRVTSYTWE